MKKYVKRDKKQSRQLHVCSGCNSRWQSGSGCASNKQKRDIVQRPVKNVYACMCLQMCVIEWLIDAEQPGAQFRNPNSIDGRACLVSEQNSTRNRKPVLILKHTRCNAEARIGRVELSTTKSDQLCQGFILDNSKYVQIPWQIWLLEISYQVNSIRDAKFIFENLCMITAWHFQNWPF